MRRFFTARDKQVLSKTRELQVQVNLDDGLRSR
jgi:hypothetical protein